MGETHFDLDQDGHGFIGHKFSCDDGHQIALFPSWLVVGDCLGDVLEVLKGQRLPRNEASLLRRLGWRNLTRGL